MHPLYNEFFKYFDMEDKEGAVSWVIEKVTNGYLEVTELYSEILKPAMNAIDCILGDENKCIWKEHMRSSIVRTIIECCYPLIIKKRDSTVGRRKQRVLVLCPPEEQHEIGSRMVADFFTLCGYDVSYVGANTPKGAFLSVVRELTPKYIAISITNFYNIFAAQKIIKEIREREQDSVGNSEGRLNGKIQRAVIIVGGCAFREHPERYKEIGADIVADSFEDICKLAEGERN